MEDDCGIQRPRRAAREFMWQESFVSAEVQPVACEQSNRLDTVMPFVPPHRRTSVARG